MSDQTVRYSLQFKFLVLVGMMLLTLALVLTTVFYFRHQDQLYKRLVEKGVLLAEDLAYNATYGVSIGDPEVLDILIQGVIQRPDVVFIGIYDRDLQELAFRDPIQIRWDLDGKRAGEAFLTRSSQVHTHTLPTGEDFYEVLVPVVRQRQATILESGIPKSPAGMDSLEVLGLVRLGLSTKNLHKELDELLRISWMMTAGIVLLWLLVATVLIRRFTQPVSQMAWLASRIAVGDFTREIQVRSRDEVGLLARSFQQMSESLRRMIRNIREASQKVVETGRHLSRVATQVNEGVQVQSQAGRSISASIQEINDSIQNVARNIQDMSNFVADTSSSIHEMESSIQEVVRNTEVMESSVQETASSIVQMITSIQELSQMARSLESYVDQTLQAAQEIEASVATVEQTARNSAKLAEKVAQDAEEEGLRAVERTIEEMEQIRSAIKELSEVMNRLGTRSEQIGGILTVIEEITEQTGLLAINAAILAAQFEDRGRGFGVVADEIKNLAESTAASTKEIAELIGNVQNDLACAIRLTQKGLERVEQGVYLSNASDAVWRKVLESARTAVAMARQIERATLEQGKGIRQVAEFIQRNQQMVHQVTQATQEQQKGSQRVLEAAERMREITQIVTRVMAEQGTGSKQIAQAATQVMVQVQEIAHATTDQTRQSQRIVQSIKEIQKITDQNVQIATDLAQAVNILARQSEVLEEEIRSFRG